jgi:hypothetical protein
MNLSTAGWQEGSWPLPYGVILQPASLYCWPTNPSKGGCFGKGTEGHLTGTEEWRKMEFSIKG